VADITGGYRGPTSEPGWTGTSPRAFRVKLEKQTMDIFRGTVDGALASIQTGSPTTGAPGQPVDTGNLRASWNVQYESPTVALISTNVEYAPYIEAGVGPKGALTLRSQVGGFNSVELTKQGIDLLVNEEIVRVTEGRGV
jgi:phage gpG-like protein